MTSVKKWLLISGLVAVAMASQFTSYEIKTVPVILLVSVVLLLGPFRMKSVEAFGVKFEMRDRDPAGVVDAVQAAAPHVVPNSDLAVDREAKAYYNGAMVGLKSLDPLLRDLTVVVDVNGTKHRKQLGPDLAAALEGIIKAIEKDSDAVVASIAEGVARNARSKGRPPAP